MKAEMCKQPVWRHGDNAIEANKANLTQRRILFLKDVTFTRGKANVTTSHEAKPFKWKENGPHLIQTSHFQEAHNLRQLKSLHRSGISFLLGLGNEAVQHYLVAAYQRLGYLLTLTRERNAYCKMQVDRAEAHQSSENLSAILGNKDDHNTSIVDPLQQLYYRLANKGKIKLIKVCVIKVRCALEVRHNDVKRRVINRFQDHRSLALKLFIKLVSDSFSFKVLRLVL